MSNGPLKDPFSFDTPCCLFQGQEYPKFQSILTLSVYSFTHLLVPVKSICDIFFLIYTYYHPTTSFPLWQIRPNGLFREFSFMVNLSLNLIMFIRKYVLRLPLKTI